MAKDKKSFLLYCDHINVFEQLTDKEAGILIKHIFNYVNDKNPKMDNRTIALIFEQIKMQLKRDLKIWEAKRSKRSEAGKKGGVKSGESRRSRSKRSNASKREANEAVNVTVNANVNVRSIESAKFFELFKQSAPSEIPDEVLWREVKKLQDKYPNNRALKSKALINTWISNMAEYKPEEKKMVY